MLWRPFRRKSSFVAVEDVARPRTSNVVKFAGFSAIKNEEILTAAEKA
jgi:hypothetical protein